MPNRFVEFAGTISVTSGASTVVGTGTAFGDRDREGAQVWAQPDAAAPIRVGSVAAVDPVGVYEDLELPLVHPYNGTTLTNVDYELVDGLAFARGTTQAAIYARFAAFLQENMGLTGNLADDIDFSLVPNNSLFIDNVTRTIQQWRNGVLNEVYSIGLSFNPRGAYNTGSPTTVYAKNDLVEHGGYVFVSNIDENEGNEPDTTPASDANWTYLPFPAGGGLHIDAVGTFAERDAYDSADEGFTYLSTDGDGGSPSGPAMLFIMGSGTPPDWSDGVPFPNAASDLSFTPAGNLSSTNVQDAIEELDGEKEPANANLLKANVEDQGPLTGGARVTVKDLGNLSGNTITPDPGDRAIQKITNNGAGTIAPGSNVGVYILDIVNSGSPGAITTSGWTKKIGDPFTTTNGHKFRCHCSITGDGSLMAVQALQ